MKTNTRTHNNANAFEHSENHALEFFSKAGSLYVKKGTYYGNESTALELFKNAWRTDKETAMKLLFWLRDVRGGSGNRSATREILNWLANNYTEWVIANIDLIPKYGRWDDLKSLYKTPCEAEACEIWYKAIKSDNPSIYGLACKWADRQDSILRKYSGLSPKKFRKLLVSKTKVVETLMCENKWNKINYNTVPSVASARYKNAFLRHDPKYEEWRTSLSDEKSGNKVNADVLLPHDIIRMVNSNNTDKNVNSLAEAQLKAMPNYMENCGYRILPIVDFSGSMYTPVGSGTIQAYDVALGIGLYSSEKIGENNPFYRTLIPFSDNSKIECWKNMTLVDAIRNIPNGYCGSTNIQAALDQILDAAKLFKVSNEQIPNVLLILSDMEFNEGIEDNDTPVNESLKKWTKAGYTLPKVIYWNLAGYKSQPATCKDKNVALVSGFSPSVLKAVLSGEDFSPTGIMLKTISKYEIKIPIQ
jgi:hypothetical protein